MFIVSIILSYTLNSFSEKNPVLPEPNATKSALKQAVIKGWIKDQAPTAARGFRAQEFASLKSPRAMLVLPSGNVLVAQAEKNADSPDQISLLKIQNGKLKSVSIFAKNLHLPFGMAIWKNQFFVAEPDKILIFPYSSEKITGKEKVIAELPYPQPQRHWTRFLLLKPDGSKLYVSVGSASNVGEAPDPLDPRNAAVLEMNLDGSEQRIFASGLRNPVSLAWEPTTNELWTVVNERDELGDELVPDFLTSLHLGDFFGWPYAYWGQHPDPRQKNHADLVAKSLTPEYSLGSHVSALGITFTKGTKLHSPFNNGVLIAEHGSWNKSKFAGYKVTYVDFEKGKPIEHETDFLTGFIHDEEKSEVYGRPVATAILPDGSVLVSDDAGGKIWRVSHLKTAKE
ncbi:MAG: PQQ-dependent sugar dehydrogenase [Pseudobdellovibrio sp.]